MKLSKKVITALVVLVSGFTLIGCAPSSFEGKVDWASDMASSYMDFNDEQDAKLVPITETIKKGYPQFKVYQESLKSLLKSELQSDQFDVASVTGELTAVKSTVLGLSNELVTEFAALHATLSQEQKDKVMGFKKDKSESGFHGHQWHGKNRGKHPHSFKDFDLTPEQVDALKVLVSGVATDSIDIMVGNHQLKKIMLEEFTSETFNAEKVNFKLNSNIELVFSSIASRLPDFAKLHGLMDANQKGALVEAVDRWGTKWDEQD